MGDFVDSYTNLLNFLPSNGATEILEGVITVVKMLAVGVLRGLPGLQSMVPNGGFLTQLNTSPVGIDKYFALASDYTPTDPGLKAWAANRLLDRVFQKAANDLVVPMLGVYDKNGCGYFPIADKLVYGQGDGISHTTYFGEPRTQEKILGWLGGVTFTTVKTPTSLLLLAALVVSACAPRKEHGVYRISGDKTGATYAFSEHGPTFHVPARWSPAEPQAEQRALLVRDESEAATARCWYNVFIDSRYRGLTGKQILNRFHHPRVLQPTMADTAKLTGFDILTIHGLPAIRSSWSFTGTSRGIQVPIRMRLVSIAYKEGVISSVCMASEFDCKLLSTELDDIQLSFKAPA